MSFNESNTVEQMILDAAENLGRTTAVEPMHDKPPGASLGDEFKPARWSYVPGLQVPRQPGDVMQRDSHIINFIIMPSAANTTSTVSHYV